MRGRRLALLAILATARGRGVSPDKLVALLWPETDAERARPLLSDSLYLVRSALGEDALIASGDQLRLNTGRVPSDVETFERLLEDGQLPQAIEAYRGPFLDGFHIDESQEFERWVDGERARLAGLFVSAIDAVAEGSERTGDWDAAVVWLRRLAAQDPYAGRVAARLMRALEQSGNRAGALQHARVHATLVREEFGAEPDPEVLALVDRLKAEPAERLVQGTAPAVSSPVAIDIPPSAASSPTSSPLPPPTPSLPNAPRPRRIATVTAVLAVVVIGTVLMEGDRSPSRAVSDSTTTPVAPVRSIAVLPFDDLGPGADNGYFTDGLTEEVIGALSRVEGLRVAARSSSFALRGARLDARAIGDTLRVATLLEGSVRRDGTRVRVSAQLVDANNGYQLWSKSYDRQIQDVIALQYDIASEIVGALELRLGPGDALRASGATPNADAYDLYLRGIVARNKLTAEDLRNAVDYFDRAIRLDSNYAPAYAGKATSISPMVWFGHLPREQGYAALRSAARRAVALDEKSSEAHVALGMQAFFFEWNWPEAEREFRRAVALNPSHAHAHHFLANFLKAMGRVDEAVAERRTALALDPLSVRTAMLLGSDYYVQGKYDSAAKYFRRASEMEPQSPIVLGHGPRVDLGLGHVYERQGRYDVALREYLQVDSLSGVSTAQLNGLRSAFRTGGIRGYWRHRAAQAERGPVSNNNPVQLALMWSHAADTARAVEWVERAYRERSLGLVFLGIVPDFDVTWSDGRVMAIMNVMNLRPANTRASRDTATGTR